MWGRSPRALERQKGEERGKRFPVTEGRVVPKGWLMSQGSISATFCHIYTFHFIGLVQNLHTIKVEKMVDSEALWGKTQIMPITFTHVFIHLHIHTTVFMYQPWEKYHGRQKYTRQGSFSKSLHPQQDMAYTHSQTLPSCTQENVLNALNKRSSLSIWRTFRKDHLIKLFFE